MLSFFAFLLPMGCTARNPKRVKVKKAAKIEIVDSMARKAVNDSVYAILMNGKIKSMLVSEDGNGIHYDEIKFLSRDDCHLLRFLVTAPDIYLGLGNAKMYGKFMPCIRFEFQKNEDEVVSVNLDFGLKIWTMTDKKGDELYKSALSATGLLRFSHFLYPKNVFIKNLYYSTQK